MATTYAEIAKKPAPDENLDANIITNNRTSTYRDNNVTVTDDSYSENYDAAIYRQDTESDNKKIVEDMKKLVVDANERQRNIAKRGGNEVNKWSKTVVFLTVAVDVALAGLLVGTVYKKPAKATSTATVRNTTVFDH